MDKKPHRQANSLRILLLLAVIAILASPAGALAADAPVPPAYQAPAPEDFGDLPWSEAFDKLHAKFSAEYAFTAWKKIDWPALYNKYKPLIDRAEAAGDFPAYYLALRQYAHSIPDGHVRVDAIRAIDDKYIGGGFGFAAARLADGTIIAAWVDGQSAAYAQGLKAGAEITAWNGRPVQDALREVPVIFGSIPATAEDLANQRARWLTRAPLGARATVAFLRDGQPAVAAVVAYDDKGQSLAKTYPAAVLSDGLRDLIVGAPNPSPPPASMVEKKILAGNIGYIKIWGELDLDLADAGQAPSTLGLFRAALAEFNAAGVKGLILDIRNNIGGLDAMAADMLASFYPAPRLYEYLYGLNAATGAWQPVPADPGDSSPDPGLYIKPAPPFFRGPVVALINGSCKSSGEGLALGVKNLPNGETLGFYGTSGSFGMAGGEAKMPGGIEIHWPYGQSLDKSRQIQLDSRDGIGGVAPSIRVPMTRHNALRAARGEDIELEHAVRIIAERIR
jgi:carboxyl-terminal processing protease